MTQRARQIPFPTYSRRVADTTARDAIVHKYAGLTVFVVADNEIHIWNGFTWDEVGGGGMVANTPDVLIDCGTIMAPSENVLIDAGTII